MKTSAQRLERTEIIELVPEVLHLKKILVPIDFSPMARPKRRTLPRRFPTLATAACAAFGV